MANDPNRDLLPVKDIDERSCRGTYCRADRNVVVKLKRCDLEDKYMRLYDENTQLKKHLNCQEEKIKRLGTKLLRLMSEKKSYPDNNTKRIENKGLEELRMKIIELQHENYTLKDKNVVLKQQLASHARHHVAAHRSPNRSLHTSPRNSNRQSSAPNVNDNYILSSRNHTQDVQLREAEEHIHGLNEEIKSLHNKIDVLQQDLEKNCLEAQKTKVSENIELIRLQRSLKQQSIQIASLQAHLKSSERSQKLLRDELAAAHKENEESLQVISDKQKEIIDLYTRIDETKLIRLEQEEMKERINDLKSERDSLRERGEFLMKTIEVKSSESDIVNDLKKLLVVEKTKKEELKQSLENTQKVLQSLKDSAVSISQSSMSNNISETNGSQALSKETKSLVDIGTQTASESLKPFLNIKTYENELELLTATQLVPYGSDGRKRNSLTGNEYENALKTRESGKNYNHKSIATETEDFLNYKYLSVCKKESYTQTERRGSDSDSSEMKRISEAEKLNLERELEYVKQMLRSQNERCSNQDEEITQLKNNLRISEEKYNDTLRRLDLHLKIFRHLDSRAGRSAEDVKREIEVEESGNKKLLKNFEVTSESISSQIKKNGKQKFLHRKYLKSSDDEDNEYDFINKDDVSVQDLGDKTKSLKKKILSKKLRGNERLGPDSSDSVSPNEIVNCSGRSQGDGVTRPVPKPRTELSKTSTETISAIQKMESQKLKRGSKPGENISICIEWLKIEPETSLWNNDRVKLLFVDFRFLDVKGEETETPSSLKKPKKSDEKCLYNFTKFIDINEYRLNSLHLMKDKSEDELIVFKVVSEPDESSDEDECLDVGIAVITVKQFFGSDPNTSLLLTVKNAVEKNEKIGILSVKLNISGISEYLK